MFHYILEYCILLCHHSISTLIVPVILRVLSALHWLIAATSGTLMFLLLSLALAYAVAFAVMVHHHGWPRPRFGLHAWFYAHYMNWRYSPVRYFLRNTWELYKITHDLHAPLSLQCSRSADDEKIISLKLDNSIVRAETHPEGFMFLKAHTSNVEVVEATQAVKVHYSKHQFARSIIVEALPEPPRQKLVADNDSQQQDSPALLEDDHERASPQPAPSNKRQAGAGGKQGSAKRRKP